MSSFEPFAGRRMKYPLRIGRDDEGQEKLRIETFKRCQSFDGLPKRTTVAPVIAETPDFKVTCSSPSPASCNIRSWSLLELQFEHRQTTHFDVAARTLSTHNLFPSLGKHLQKWPSSPSLVYVCVDPRPGGQLEPEAGIPRRPETRCK